MADAHANFAYSTVATAPSPATSGTSLTVQTGDGAVFPAAPFNAVVWPVTSNPLGSNAEIVRVTAVVGDVLTITRTQESTTARSITVGDQIGAAITAKTITDAEAAPYNYTHIFTTADQTINSGVLNLLTDLTSLSFSVTSGHNYYFYFEGVYTADASTTGSRWTINGPAMTRLVYTSTYGLTATTVTANPMLTAIQLPAASNATSNVSNGGANIVQVEGMCTPSANGTIQFQGAREVTLGNITLRAGAWVRWREMVAQ